MASRFTRLTEFFKRIRDDINLRDINPIIEKNIKRIAFTNVAAWTATGLYTGYNNRKIFQKGYNDKGKYTRNYPLKDHIGETMVFTGLFCSGGVLSSIWFLALVDLFGAMIITGPLLVGGIISTGVCIGRTIENGDPWKDPLTKQQEDEREKEREKERNTIRRIN
jgi:hypothetical protein